MDNSVATFMDYDVVGRPVLVRAAEGKSEETQTTTEYSDTSRRVIVRSDLNDVGDARLVTIQHYDQLGRVRLSRRLEDSTQSASNETQGIKVQTRYKFYGSNSYALVSHPYREASSSQAPTPAMDWTRSQADISGRMVEVRKFGASLPWPWGANTTSTGGVTTTYDANVTTVIDQAGRLRRSVVNGLGQLVRVDEPDKDTGALDSGGVPVQSTSYTYDAVSNLLNVNQGQQPARSFAYNSLGRLISAANPESGTVTYLYDANGNLTDKTDARGVLSHYIYDALNRNTSISYTNDPAETPEITRSYDGATNGKGRWWKSQTSGDLGSLNTIDTYDALGRPRQQRQQFFDDNGHWSQAYTLQRTYDRASHVLTQTYPSGHTVNYLYDLAGQTSSFSGNLGEGTPRTYASELKYTERGALEQERFGTTTPLYHKQRYNERGQLWDMRLSTVPLSTDPANGDRGAIVNYYSDNFVQGGTGPDNNGNLLRQETYIPGSSFLQDNFSYDKLSRLTSISENLNGTGANSFKQAYQYDRWGNRTFDQANTTTNLPHPNYTASAVNNRLIAPTGYVYDADGRRERRLVGGPVSYETRQVYGFDGELLAEYPQYGDAIAVAQPEKEYGYRNGQLLVTAEPFVNVALNKPATQTNNFSGTTTADKAVNGDANGRFNSGSVSATNYGLNSWWQVDLQSVQSIDNITIWGRTDCCPEMTTDFYVFVSDAPFSSTDLNTTLAQSGVSNYHYSEYAGPASISVTRTGRYVRVQIVGTMYLVLGEVQVWTAAAKVNWLVADQLGTPRIIADRTGSTAGLSRHDYLPFGEEVPTVFRNGVAGYAASDSVRQKFTSKERDNETGLDYFLARYYSSGQGRFTSPDEFTGGPDELYNFADDAADNPTFYADLRNPQSLNKYQYSFNNPLRYVDPDGHDPAEPEPQDPMPVVPVLVPVGLGLPVPIALSPTTPGPSDRQIIRGLLSIPDTLAHYTGIEALADWLRPKIWPTPAPAPTTTTTPRSQAQPVAPLYRLRLNTPKEKEKVPKMTMREYTRGRSSRLTLPPLGDRLRSRIRRRRRPSHPERSHRR